MRGWPLFFGTVSFLIVATLITPHLFGLQSFTQWGGMYTDGWCNVTLSSEALEDPQAELPAGVQTWELRSSSTSLVWYAPMHTQESCSAWARSHCGKDFPGWTVRGAYPYFRGAHPLEKRNACDLPPSPWFPR